jgi:hypothetical protein
VGIPIVLNQLRQFLIPVSGYTLVSRSAFDCSASVSVA